MSSSSLPVMNNKSAAYEPLIDSESPSPHPSDKERWKSIIISLIVLFLLMVQNSMYFTNLWPYMKQIDPSATQSFYGIALMVAGLCLAATSPLFGWWSSKIQNCKIPVYAGITLVLGGNLLVGLAETFPANRKYVLMVGRILSGIGQACYTALFSYVIMATKVEERRTAVSIRAAFITVAMFLGPAVASAFVPIGFPGRIPTGTNLHLDMYSSIAWLNIAICILLYLIVGFLFKEYWIALAVPSQSGPRNTNGTSRSETNLGQMTLKPYDKIPMFVCWYIRFVYLFMLNIDRAIGTAFIMIMFKWTPGEAISYSAIIQLATGLMDFCGNLIMGNIVLKYVKERNVMVLGLSIALGYFLFNFSWPGLPPINASQLIAGDSIRALSVPNITITSPTVHPMTYDNLVNESSSYVTEDLTKCDYDWCSYTTRVSLWQYVLARFFLALSISTGFTPTSTLMSKIIGPRKQGTIQGLYAASGQIGTTLSPLIMATSFQYLGPRVAYAIGASVNISALVLVILTFKRLVGWQDYSELERRQLNEQLNESAPLIDPIVKKEPMQYGI